MGQGRGNSAIIAIMLLFCMLVFHFQIAHAYTTHIVGDAAGWTFNVNNWPNGKRFVGGDNFVFKYDPKVHNLVKVDEEGYKTCTRTGNIAVFTSGNDTILLVSGTHYFICLTSDHCQQRGMKMAINVL
ncbi:hypothetical protein Lal_00003195 [Lupinus albus]|uniref:Basic blue protein n=1 Tax=Lupinus albus TaxID=3870 RepID=A0A6A4NPT6_LUPAL|nr:putative cupredoxin [Lupinus albus]KAF1883013.1 hypothetical protein Lal_00003195 [Lupinus albus]